MTLTYEQLRSNAQRLDDELLKDRVLAGIEVLNAYDPDWANYIDPSILLLESPTQCVLGQVFDTARPTREQWALYVDEHHPHARSNGERERLIDHYERRAVIEGGFSKGLAILDGDVLENPERYGFEANSGDEYDDLTNAWLVALGEEDPDE